MTEQMSDIVARAHLRATQMQIMFLTAGAAEKRTEFTNLMFSILNEEQKEHAMDKAEKVSKSPRSSPNRGRVSSTRRYRHGAPSPLGALGRVVDDSWSPDNDNVVDNDPIRSTLDEFLTQAAALDPQQRAENATRMWACSACTYMNTNPGFRCAMCGGHR